MFKKLLGKIARPIIKREMEKMMRELVQPFLDLVRDLVQPQQGTKFLVTLASVGSIVFLHMRGFSSTTSDAVVGLMAIAYYLADIWYKTKVKNNGTIITTDNGDQK